jgi:hypothetical protein
MTNEEMDRVERSGMSNEFTKARAKMRNKLSVEALKRIIEYLTFGDLMEAYDPKLPKENIHELFKHYLRVESRVRRERIRKERIAR